MTALGHHRLLLAGSTRARRCAAGAPRSAPRRGATGSAGGPGAVVAAAARRATTCGSSPAASWTRGSDRCTPPRCGCSSAAGVGVALPGPGGAAAVRSHVHAGLDRRRPPPRPSGHGVDARRRADPRRLGRLRRRAEGLRPPPRHRRGSRVHRPRASTSTSGWRRGLDSLPTPTRSATAGRGAGSRATSATCSAPTCPCARCWRRTSSSSSSTTRGCAAARAAPTRRCTPRRQARSGRASSSRSPARGADVVASANPGCALHLAAAGLESVTRWRSSPRPSRVEPSMAGEFDDIRSRLEAIAEELADLAIDAAARVDRRRGYRAPGRRAAAHTGSPLGRRRRSRSCKSPTTSTSPSSSRRAVRARRSSCEDGGRGGGLNRNARRARSSWSSSSTLHGERLDDARSRPTGTMSANSPSSRARSSGDGARCSRMTSWSPTQRIEW